MKLDLAAEIWMRLAGDPAALNALELQGPSDRLPAVYGVTNLATASIGVACLSVAEVWGLRSGAPIPTVQVDSTLASAAFLAERLVQAVGWHIPPLWEEIGGDYPARNGWIRLHMNYSHHRNVALRVLGAAPERHAIAAAVATWDADELDTAISEAGGCAAIMRSAAEWSAHPHGRYAITEGAISVTGAIQVPVDESLGQTQASRHGPLAGIRVLDITRVIAGPISTWFLSAYGAEVLRIDPPGFNEMGAVLPVLTAGKRCAALDLRRTEDRKTFERLVANAHVLVHGLRPGAMSGLGYGAERLAQLNPSIIVATVDAYGWTGPWAGRRGFDSLVQMSCGIAAEGARQANVAFPVPLPAQALDYGTGYLLAAGICKAIVQRIRNGTVASVRASLVGVANLLMRMPQQMDPDSFVPWPPDVFQEISTYWGQAHAVRCPGTITGFVPKWPIAAGPIGREPARWSDPA